MYIAYGNNTVVFSDILMSSVKSPLNRRLKKELLDKCIRFFSKMFNFHFRCAFSRWRLILIKEAKFPLNILCFESKFSSFCYLEFVSIMYFKDFSANLSVMGG